MKKRCRKSGKVKFDTHESALMRAGEILNEPDNANLKCLGAYRCDFCGKWHLTKNVYDPHHRTNRV